MNKYPLRSLFWECTLKCNAYCRFCGSRCGDVCSEEIDGDTLLLTLREIAERYCPKDIMINVTGGEPLLRRDLFDVMKKASELGFNWGMVTNGTLISDGIIEKMKAAGMRTVAISVDGTKKTHEDIRGIDGCYDRIIENIKKLTAEKFLSCVQVTTVVNKKNIDELPELYRLFSELGIDQWRLALMDPVGRGEECDDIALDREGLLQYFDFINSHKSFPGLDITTSCSHYLGDYDENTRGREFFCATGKTVASILANGDIFVCPNVPRKKELIQGNIRTDSFVDIWENGFKVFRSDDRCSCDQCKNCEHLLKCRGDSWHTWDFESNAPKFCFAKKDITKREKSSFEKVLDAYKKEYEGLVAIDVSYGSNMNKKIVFSPFAAEKMFNCFDFGEATPHNLCEQIAALYGHYIENVFLVEHVVPLPMEDRSTEKGAVTEDTVRVAVDELRILNENINKCRPIYSAVKEPFVFGGTVHSHPDTLPCLMSDADKTMHEILQRKFPSYTTTLIINPQKRDLVAFCKDNCDTIDIEILTADHEKWGIFE